MNESNLLKKIKGNFLFFKQVIHFMYFSFQNDKIMNCDYHWTKFK